MSADTEPSPLDGRREQAFPKLSGRQVDRLRRLGDVRRVGAGALVFTQGQQSVPFFVVLSGRVEVVYPQVSGEERLITVHETNEFTGEASLLSGRRTLVTGRALEPTELLEIPMLAFASSSKTTPS